MAVRDGDPVQAQDVHPPPMRGLLLFGLAFAALVAGAWIRWELSYEQLGVLGLAGTSFTAAWLVWRHGIVGFVHREGFGAPPETHVTEAPLPREVLAPALVLAGVVLVLAATPTPVGDALFGPVRGAILLYELGERTIGLIVSAAILATLIGCLVTSLVRRDGELFFAACLAGGLFGIFALALYGAYRLQPDAYRDAWNDYLEPFRFVAGLFT